MVYLSILSLLGILRRGQYDTAHLMIFLAIVFALIADVLMRLFGLLFHNNIVIYNVSNLIEFFIIFFFYYKLIGKSIKAYIIGGILAIFLLFYLLELSQKGLLEMFSYSFLYKNITLLTLAVLANQKITNQVKTPLITSYSVFWINTAVLFYYSCTLFIFGLRKYTVDLHNLNLVATYLHLFFIFVFYGMLTIGLWKAHKN
jgi:hypothetical protein